MEFALEILSTLGLGEFLSIACYRYGVSEAATENPVTVIVSIRKQFTREWTTATRQVREVLDQFGVCYVDILFLMNGGGDKQGKPFFVLMPAEALSFWNERRYHLKHSWVFAIDAAFELLNELIAYGLPFL